jgi:hypothetical protein
MRIKTYNKRRNKKRNSIKFQTPELLKWCSSMEKTHFNEEDYKRLEEEDYYIFRKEIEEAECL